jgi:hypothetical protein
MSVTITLSDELVTKLQVRAETQHLSLTELVSTILATALDVENQQDDYPTPEEVVTKIKATPPNPASIRPATGSLAEALQNAPHDPDFDLETWTKGWAAVETEMKTITRANNIAEGRG